MIGLENIGDSSLNDFQHGSLSDYLIRTVQLLNLPFIHHPVLAFATSEFYICIN